MLPQHELQVTLSLYKYYLNVKELKPKLQPAGK